MKLFGKNREIETAKEGLQTAKEILQTEVKDLDKLTLGEDSVDIPDLSPELTRLKEVATAEAEKITEKLEEPRMLPEPTEVRQEIWLDELPLKELNKKIDEELKRFRKKMKDFGNLNKLTLESKEIIDLMNLYTETTDKLNEFIEEINRLNLNVMSSNRTFAAIYKFRACKGLSDIKRELRRIESICKRAGFVPGKIHDILESRAENLIDGFLQKNPK